MSDDATRIEFLTANAEHKMDHKNAERVEAVMDLLKKMQVDPEDAGEVLAIVAATAAMVFSSIPDDVCVYSLTCRHTHMVLVSARELVQLRASRSRALRRRLRATSLRSNN